jgi:hypothetical protein
VPGKWLEPHVSTHGTRDALTLVMLKMLNLAVLGASLIAATSGVASAAPHSVSHGGGVHSVPSAGGYRGGLRGSEGGHGPAVGRGGGAVVHGGGYGGRGGYYGGRGGYGYGGGGYWRGGVWIGGPAYGYNEGYTCDPYYDNCVEPYVAPRVVVRAPIVVRGGFRRW